MSKRTANVTVRNETGRPFRFKLLHQYTGEATQESSWVEIAPESETHVLRVTYWTGIFTTGVDNWIVNGIERRKVSANITLPPGLPPIDVGGEMFVEINWRTGHGLGADWKVHTLRAEDAGEITKIVIRPTIVEFVSKSGISSTSWTAEFDISPI